MNELFKSWIENEKKFENNSKFDILFDIWINDKNNAKW